MDPLVAQMPVITGTHRARSSGEQWSSVEEGMLQALIARANLPRRSTTEQWESIASDLSTAGEAMGLPVRTASGCRNKARSMGLIPTSAPPGVREVGALHVAAQSSFAAPEIRNALAEVFEEFARKLRGAA